MSSDVAMEPRIIKTEEQYQDYLAEVERLAMADPAPDSADGSRLELVAKLVEDYERDRFVFERSDPIDAIVFRMEQQGLRQKDIAPLVGGKNRASEVLARKRPLTLPMIRALHEQLDIPSELLIGEPQPKYAARVESDDTGPRKNKDKRADQKLRYAGIFLHECRNYARCFSNDDWEKAHQEGCFYHLAGSVEALLHEIKDGYGLKLDTGDVQWHTVKQELKKSGQRSPAFDELHRLRKKDEGSWLYLLFEFRNQGTHRGPNPKVVNLSNTKRLDNYFIDPRTGDALVLDGRRDCLKVLEYLSDQVARLIEDLRRRDSRLN